MTTEITAYQKYDMMVHPWYVNLIDDCKTIVVETEFTSRWALVEGYHGLGSRILQENDNFERAKIYGEGICNAVAESLGKRTRTIYYAIQFARTYPDLNLLPEGKNTSWHHIVNKYLTDGKDKGGKKLSPSAIIQEIKKLLETEYLKAHQEAIECGAVIGNDKMCSFIRYLQDQVNKITEGV